MTAPTSRTKDRSFGCVDPVPLNVLLLCDYQTKIAATVADHIDAIERYSRNKYWRLSMLGDIPEKLDLSRYDAIIVHYTLVACMDFYLTRATRARIAAFKGLKALFIQDEYRHVDATIAALQELDIDLLFTCVPEPEIEKVYSSAKLPGVRKVNVLTGYVPEGLADRQVPPFESRPIDVGYRGRKLPAWLGELGQEKWLISNRFAEDAKRDGLVCDMSYREEDRLYGEAWIEFMVRCKAVLGVESGASVFDFSGDIQRNVDRHVAQDPTVSFETLRDLYFRDAEGKINLAQISPRCFEAAALRTLMILYEGGYSGLLQPWRHYIPLKKDHSNTEEVLAALRNPALCGEIIERAYREVALNPGNSFAAFVARVDEAVAQTWRPEMKAGRKPYDPMTFWWLSTFNSSTVKRRMYRRLAGKVHWLIYGVALGWMSPAARDRIQPHIRRIYGGIFSRLSGQRAR